MKMFVTPSCTVKTPSTVLSQNTTADTVQSSTAVHSKPPSTVRTSVQGQCSELLQNLENDPHPVRSQDKLGEPVLKQQISPGRSRDTPAQLSPTHNNTFTDTALAVAHNGAAISPDICTFTTQDQLRDYSTPDSSRICNNK